MIWMLIKFKSEEKGAEVIVRRRSSQYYLKCTCRFEKELAGLGNRWMEGEVHKWRIVGRENTGRTRRGKETSASRQSKPNGGNRFVTREEREQVGGIT